MEKLSSDSEIDYTSTGYTEEASQEASNSWEYSVDTSLPTKLRTCSFEASNRLFRDGPGSTIELQPPVTHSAL